jgi:hypothetical protein
MRPVGFGDLFIYLFIYLIHDIVYPYTTRGWNILDYSTCCRKYHSIYDLVVFPGNTSRIIENFQSSSCIIQGRYKVWQQLNISKIVSWKSLRFGMELRAFKFHSLQFFQFYTIICFRDTKLIRIFLNGNRG